MAHISLAVRGSQRIESFLKKHFNGKGKGLHEILSSVEEVIPEKTVRRARYVASVRNKVVHEVAEIDDLEYFSDSINSILADLQMIVDARKVEQQQQQQQQQHWRDSSRLAGHYKGKRNDSVVVITQTPLWAKIAITVLAFAAISSYINSGEISGVSPRSYDRVNHAEISQTPNSLDSAELARLKKVNTSLESTNTRLRKELQDVREEVKRTQKNG